jgi:hypothetical protein
MTLTRPGLARAFFAAIMLASATTAGAQPFDHLECYKIKDLAPKVKYKADLLPEQTQFLAQTGCDLKVPAKLFCIDVEKSNVVPAPPQVLNGQNTRDFLCYNLKCPPQAEVPLQVEDQFGTRNIKAKKKPFQLCAPAHVIGDPDPATPTPCQPPATPTPTTTTLPNCMDGIQNGSETDLDCGGGTCPTCALGKQCLAGSDCTSGACSGGVCISSTFTLTVAKAGAGNGTVTSTPAGINCGMDCSEPYNSGTMVNLTASPNMGSTFAGWSGGGCSGTGACVVTVTAATTVTATFSLQTFTLTVATAGAGSGTVTSSPAGINCGVDCSEAYSNGTMVNLTASPNVGSTFAGWSGAGCSGTGVCVVTMTAAASVTATFTPQTFTLTVAKAGIGSGTVTSSPAGINCGVDCSEPYSNGTTVNLTATPDPGSSFAGWSGSGCSGTGVCIVTITAAASVTATFDSP